MSTGKDVLCSTNSCIYCFADSVELCRNLIEGGARIIQFRNKKIDDAGFHAMALEMKSIIKDYKDTIFIINDRVDIAIDVKADGVHVGRGDEDYSKVIRRVPESMIVGVSARTVEGAREAENAGAAYLGTGAVFPTPTKPDAEVIGLEGLRRVVEAVNIPVVAIGGISKANIRKVMKTRANYYAVISEINKADDVAGKLREFWELLNC